MLDHEALKYLSLKFGELGLDALEALKDTVSTRGRTRLDVCIRKITLTSHEGWMVENECGGMETC